MHSSCSGEDAAALLVLSVLQYEDRPQGAMILRGLGERLRQQDWIAVTIEFALVVAGVFLGIQMSNWNDQRKERATEGGLSGAHRSGRPA